MLDVTYYKDYRHNYLILKDNGCLTENVYQRKMVTGNKIKGLLECQERHINGELLLYYEITSRQSLFSIYDGKNIGMEELRKFFMQLKGVSDRLQKYLLDGSCLVLQPEYIFQDMESGECFFLYYPDAEEGTFSQLINFFLSKVDNEDMEAVGLIYKMADLIEREQFVQDEVLKWFQDDIVDCMEEKKEAGNFKEISGSGVPAREEFCFSEEESGNGDLEKDCKEKEEKENKKNIFHKILFVWGMWVLGIGSLIYLKYYFELTYRENIYLVAGGIFMTALVLAFSAWAVYGGRIKNREKEKNTENQEESYNYIDASEYDAPASAADSGNTVFIPWTENCENKLYSMDKKNKCHIDLGKLPLTVGKLAGAVDMVIKEQSISRMHAKFSRVGNSIYVSDLNSTNGTFKNGMRLTPNTSEMIEPGDEIRLGKLKFIYR
ncbi:MAG: FHA domain-containing protein [Clostridium sp.]|nr:FHA domain-containing protein [Clostridium sp.]